MVANINYFLDSSYDELANYNGILQANDHAM